MVSFHVFLYPSMFFTLIQVWSHTYIFTRLSQGLVMFLSRGTSCLTRPGISVFVMLPTVGAQTHKFRRGAFLLLLLAGIHLSSKTSPHQLFFNWGLGTRAESGGFTGTPLSRNVWAPQPGEGLAFVTDRLTGGLWDSARWACRHRAGHIGLSSCHVFGWESVLPYGPA